MKLRVLHAVAGVAGVILFVLSGQYMHLAHGHLAAMPDTPRLLFRSAHIYLLMSALLNLALGLYMQPQTGKVARLLQTAGSAMVLAAPALFAVSFFTESLRGDIGRPAARYAAYLCLGGAMLHLIAVWVLSGRRKSTEYTS